MKITVPGSTIQGKVLEILRWKVKKRSRYAKQTVISERRAGGKCLQL